MRTDLLILPAAAAASSVSSVLKPIVVFISFDK
jgi:hypothetical protein